MEEASSKFVDTIATRKLLESKLTLVQHRSPAGVPLGETGLGDPAAWPLLPETAQRERTAAGEEVRFPSHFRSGAAENDTVVIRRFRREGASREVLLLHGLYEENWQIYSFLIMLLQEEGVDVALLVLPYHYDRQPAGSAFSGEYFWSGDVPRSARAFRQATCDLVQAWHLLRREAGRPVGLAGFSMGGGVALTASTLFPFDAVFAINPVCNIPDLVWRRPLFATVRADLEAQGLAMTDVDRYYHDYDPLNRLPAATPARRIAIAVGEYDQINDPLNYERLRQRWQPGGRFDYRAGHLNILRVPKLAGDIAAWCRSGE